MNNVMYYPLVSTLFMHIKNSLVLLIYKFCGCVPYAWGIRTQPVTLSFLYSPQSMEAGARGLLGVPAVPRVGMEVERENVFAIIQNQPTMESRA